MSINNKVSFNYFDLQLSIYVIVYTVTLTLENSLNPFYNRDQKRLRTAWRLILQWLLYLIPTTLGTAALLFFQTSFYRSKGWDLMILSRVQLL